MDIEILYEDENVVAVNKPAGLIVHGDGKTDGLTLVDWILEKYPNIKEVGEPVTAKALVDQVLFFDNLDETTIRSILEKYGREDGLRAEDIPRFFEIFKNKKMHESLWSTTTPSSKKRR